jgi:hypothetical protein
MKKVAVTAGPSGQAIVTSKDSPEFGYVRVAQDRNIVDERGWLRNKTIAALILGSVLDLKKAGYQNGQELEGKIVIKESLTPFNKKNPEKDLKVAGKTGITCMVGESPIYRKAFYSMDANAQDVLVEHTNVEAIRAKYAADLATAGKTADLKK